MSIDGDREARGGRRTGLWSWTLLLAAVLFGMVLASGLDWTVPTLAAGDDGTRSEQAGDQVAANATASIASFADLAEAVLPAVVSVRATTIEEVEGDAESTDQRFFFDRFFQRRPQRERRADGGGSGFVVSADGWIVTNNHVIDGATRVRVTIDDREIDAEIRGQDEATDLALLKVDRTGLSYLDLGDSESLRVGDWVMVVGNPLQLQSSVTVGVVSAKGRSLAGLEGGDRSFDDFIQTDAAINRGNSGGPLVNTRGQVVGIATAMNYGAENIGFAVPVSILSDVLPQLRDEGRVTRGYLGVNIRNLSHEEAEYYDLESPRGALVLQVVEETPAAKAGIQAGDLILEIDGNVVDRTESLIGYVSRRRPGQRVELELLRNGQRVSKTVLLEERDASVAFVEPEPPVEDSSLEWLGLQYEDLDEADRRELGIPEDVTGVLVVDVLPSSPLWEQNIRPGWVIRRVNGEAVESAAEFEELVGTARSGELLRLYYQAFTPRGGSFANFAIVRVP